MVLRLRLVRAAGQRRVQRGALRSRCARANNRTPDAGWTGGFQRQPGGSARKSAGGGQDRRDKRDKRRGLDKQDKRDTPVQDG